MRSDVLNKSSGKYDGKTRPTSIFDWDYISCSPPILSAVGNSATDVMADGDKGSMLWPGKGGQLYPSTVCYIGAFTAVGTIPNVDGAVPATDTNSTVAGLNMQMDSETAGNVGIEIVLGGSQFGSESNKIIAGTHSASIDVTWNNADWTDYDACVIGLRKAEEFNTGHAGILAAATGDPLYTDFVAFGCQSPDDVQIASDLNNGGSGTYTDTTDATAANHNHRFRIDLDSDGKVTYKHIGAAAMKAGTLAAPSTTATYTFDSGDTLVPYMIVFGTGQDSAVYLKSIEVTRSPSVGGHSVA
tara:strand:- start:73 stop:972 length:900 start_codon:yes stop_codon:yes gene_type:complete